MTDIESLNSKNTPTSSGSPQGDMVMMPKVIWSIWVQLFPYCFCNIC